MRYAIITNPASGKMTFDQKRAALAEVAEILDVEIHGLDTIKASDLAECAQYLATRCDVLVTAGEDGTLSDIINSGLFQSLIGAVTSFISGNCIGQYRTGRQLTVNLERPLVLQIDGNDDWEADAFTFKVLPNALKLKC